MPRIEFAVTCQRCATQLQGMDSTGICPSCGRPIAETVDDRILDLFTGTVAVDLTCAECSYNLRTLRFDSACPECGTPVLKSLGVEELRFCDPRWLRKVHRGISIILISVLVSIIFGIMAGAGVALLAGLRSPPSTGVLLLFMLPSIIGYGLVLIGTFYITSAKPGEPAGERTNRIGRIVRVLLFVSFVLAVISMIITAPFATLTGGTISKWSFPLGTVQSLLYGCAAIGALIVLSRIAVLGRRRGLRKLGRVLAWFAGFLSLGQSASSIYMYFIWPTIASGIPASPFASTTTSTTVGGGPGITTVTVSSNAPGTFMPGTSTTESAGSNAPTAPPAAPVPGAGVTPATPVPPMAPFAALAVFGCFSGIVTIGTFVLGLIVLVKYRNLLGSAVAASVTSVRLQPPLTSGPPG